MPAKIKTNSVPQPEPVVQPAQSPFYSRPSFLFCLLACLFLALSILLGWQNHKLKTDLVGLQNQLKSSGTNNQSNPNDVLAQADKQLVEAVGKLMILPADEAPTIATVTDLEKLKGQPFFANAAVGDKVLIYTKAQKAILYRPSEDKIIELAPLNIGSGSAGTANKLSVEIRNGSGVSGAGSQMKAKLATDSEFSVAKVTNAKITYPKTLLYLANSAKSALAGVLQNLTSAQMVGALPAGEPASSAEAVLILGQQ